MRFTITTALVALLTSGITLVLSTPIEETTQLGTLENTNDAAGFTVFESIDQEMNGDNKLAKAQSMDSGSRPAPEPLTGTTGVFVDAGKSIPIVGPVKLGTLDLGSPTDSVEG